MSGLTDFQVEVARLFFSLPASDGFVLAGGAALLVSGRTTRPTEDLDLFGERGRSKVVEAGAQFTVAATMRGWIVSPGQTSASFVRLHVQGDDELSSTALAVMATSVPSTLIVACGSDWRLSHQPGCQSLPPFEAATM